MGKIGQVIEGQEALLGSVDDPKLTDAQKEYVLDTLAELVDQCRAKHSGPTVEEPELVETTFVPAEAVVDADAVEEPDVVDEAEQGDDNEGPDEDESEDEPFSAFV